MAKSFIRVVYLLLLAVSVAAAEDKIEEGDAKVLSGMSIVGNNETPKSLTIIPWRSAEVSKETKLTSNLLNEKLSPLDKDEFLRELDFYKLSNPE